jgi:hypothetical protein
MYDREGANGLMGPRWAPPRFSHAGLALLNTDRVQRGETWLNRVRLGSAGQDRFSETSLGLLEPD